MGCPGFEESMKPAIETPGGVSTDPYSKTVCCLRCGHVEFLADSSPLLQNLELVALDSGDGD